jgi:hypothetical protein
MDHSVKFHVLYWVLNCPGGTGNASRLLAPAVSVIGTKLAMMITIIIMTTITMIKKTMIMTMTVTAVVV